MSGSGFGLQETNDVISDVIAGIVICDLIAAQLHLVEHYWVGVVIHVFDLPPPSAAPQAGAATVSAAFLRQAATSSGRLAHT
jgi:hypothetical protein